MKNSEKLLSFWEKPRDKPERVNRIFGIPLIASDFLPSGVPAFIGTDLGTLAVSGSSQILGISLGDGRVLINGFTGISGSTRTQVQL